MKRRCTVKRRGPWSLAKVFKANKWAPVVWLGLVELADGQSVVTPTRKELSALTGINRIATISKALSILVLAGWITREVIPVQGDGHEITAKVLKITIRRSARRADGVSRRRSAQCADGNAIGRRSAQCADGSRRSARCADGVFIDRRSSRRTPRRSTRCAMTLLSEEGRGLTPPPPASTEAAGATAQNKNGALQAAPAADEGPLYSVADIMAGRITRG